MMGMAQAFEVGDAVILPDGTVGLLTRVEAFGHSSVEINPGGPVRLIEWKQLRHATRSDVAAAGFDGYSMRIKAP